MHAISCSAAESTDSKLLRSTASFKNKLKSFLFHAACLHREHFVNSGMRHRSDRERTTSHMLLLLLFVFHCNCAYLSSFPRRNRVYAKMIRRIFAPSLTLALSQRSSKSSFCLAFVHMCCLRLILIVFSQHTGQVTPLRLRC